ncbi:serine hydrolase [soil metagenome]
MNTFSLADDPKPLSEVATSLAKSLPKGAIVTAERVGDTVKYAAAGKLEPDGIAPERIIFEIGSISKVFTGLLLAQAVIEKKVNLDTTLQMLLGKDFSFADPRAAAISLRQLATHTSGLPRLPEDLAVNSDPLDPYAHYDRAKLSAYLAKTKLKGEPPYAKSYSNFGMGLLGDILSRVYDMPWDALIAEKITGPLGMQDTSVVLREEQQKRFAPAYDGAKPMQPWNLNALSGAGALRSTAADLVLFGEALLHPEKTPLKEAFALMLTPQTREGDMGLAIFLSKLYDHRVYEHSGGTGGYRSALHVLPETNTVQVVLINNAAMEGEAVIAHAYRQKPRTTLSDRVVETSALAAYEGVYPIDPTARFTVVRRDDQLWTQLTGQTFLQLHTHEKTDRFFLKEVAAEIQFLRDDDKVTSLILFQNGREVKAKKGDDPTPVIKFRKPEELTPFVGTYELTPKARFTLKIVKDTLFVQLTGQSFLPVFEKRDDWFEYDVVPAVLEFERDRDGKVIALKLHQNGAIQRAEKK